MTLPPALPEGAEGTLLRLVTAGSVDDGKSTLIGRLLYDARQILSDQLEQVRETSVRRGADSRFVIPGSLAGGRTRAWRRPGDRRARTYTARRCGRRARSEQSPGASWRSPW